MTAVKVPSSIHLDGITNGSINKLRDEDRSIHDWYRFVLSFPPHLVRHYLDDFGLTGSSTVLDPFCGTGTVVVEAKKQGINSVGIEANPMAALASKTKIRLNIDPQQLVWDAENAASAAIEQLSESGLTDCPDEANAQSKTELLNLPESAFKLLLKDSLGPLAMHKSLILLDKIKEFSSNENTDHLRLAFAKTLVFSSSNLHFGPEVGVRRPKSDAAVIKPWLENVQSIAKDIYTHRQIANTPAEVHHADSRQMEHLLRPSSISAVFTSPPYPNEKDYTRTTRLETVMLGMANNREELRQIKKGLVRSNTRGVYVTDDDDRYAEQYDSVMTIAAEIERRRIEMGKTSGFERMYHRVTKLYFGGMARQLAELRPLLQPGAKLGYVVGDQASYLQVMIPTGDLLAEIAESLGYRYLRSDLFRTRIATATKQQLVEETVVLQWPG